ncbi:MAG: branched-chain amino acid transaminase [bacterium]|nr:branched-chain amino acid transaminase [bacterium]
MSNRPKAEVLWFDGEYLPWDAGTVHLQTHTLHYGLGVFEGIRAYEQTSGGTAVFRLDDHLRRLEGSAKILEMNLPYDRKTLKDVCLELIRRNQHDACYIRPLAVLGAGSMGVYPKDNPVEVSVMTWPWGAYLGDEALTKGIRCKVSSYARHFPNAALLKAKATGNYINSVLAKREAVRLGYEEAIMLDIQGNVAEGSGENLFILRDGKLITPPLNSVLQGITRDTIMKLAVAEGLEVYDRFFTRDELYLAEEAFLTGTAAEVTPIREVDDRLIGEGRPGPLTLRLQKRYFQVIRGELEEYKEWLEPVTAPTEAEVAAREAEALHTN